MRDDETCRLRLEPHSLESQAVVISQAGNGAGEVRRLCLVCLFLYVSDVMEETPKGTEPHSSYDACLYV